MNVARLLRVGSMLFVGAVLAACLLGGAAAIYAPPGGDLYRLAGIATGAGNGTARVPRRSLDCARQIPNVLRESCRLTVDGAALTVEVEYYPLGARNTPSQWGFRECRVAYRERTDSCRAASFVIVGPPYAVFSGSELGLPEGTARALRQHYLLESLSEADWKRAARVMEYLLATAAALVAFHTVPARAPVRAVAAVGVGLLAFRLANFGLLLLLLFAGVVD